MENYKKSKVCILLPDYSTSQVDYQHYDPPRILSDLIPEFEVHHVFLNKLTVYKQLKDLSKLNYLIFVNLCEGYLDWEVPSIDVIYNLDLLGLPYTGPNQRLYDPTKELMKYVAFTQGIQTPAHVLISDINEVDSVCDKLSFPLFIKPSKAGDSLGIDDSSLVFTTSSLKEKTKKIIDDYGPLLVEEFIDGREFTVMVLREAGTKEGVITFRPVEYIFPNGKKFKTYAMKTSELHADANVRVADDFLSERLEHAAADIFNAFEGVGYARLDFRMSANGSLYFLEINFTCSVFYGEGFEGSADHILKLDGRGQSFFLRKIIEEGLHRFQIKQKKYTVKGNSISGYGIYATKDLQAGEVVFKGEERSQRIATKSYIQKNWSEKENENFRRYAYPVSKEVFMLWDENPSEWAPQNHSCNANTRYLGLNVVTITTVKIGEELTLDYSDFLDEHMEPFQCNCGCENCRGYISGIKGNSIDQRAAHKDI
jgi:D-alanine-D-alanine ligase